MRTNLEIIFTGSSKAAERMSAEMNAMITEVLDTKGSSLSPEAKYDLEAA
jgi:hypothetical protein